MNDNIVNFTEEGNKLVDLFKELEEVIRKKCNSVGIKTDNVPIDSQIKELSKKNSVVRRYQDELLIIKQVRNINTHQRNDKYGYVVCPNPDMNIKLKSIVDEINNPPTIYNSNMCIKRQNMYCKTLNDTIEATIKDMVDKIYTHIPILENGIVIGVFSESTLLDIVNVESGIVVDKNTKFSDILEYLKIENHSTEDFIFISRNKNIYDVEDIFKDYFVRKKRLGCVYITENGKPSESILGMLTAWDILGN